MRFRSSGNSLIALSSAAVIAVYTAGYTRTRSAAERLTIAAERRIDSPPSAVVARSTRPDLTARPELAARSAPPAPAAPRVTTERPDRLASSPRPDAPAAVADPEPSSANSALPSAPVVPEAQTAQEAPPIAVPQPDIPEAVPAPPSRTSEYKDGTYLGWGYSRHGDIQASVVIQGGRIVSADIAQCRTRYSCSWVENLPRQILDRQAARVDFVSGATQSSYAFEDAVAEALLHAK